MDIFSVVCIVLGIASIILIFKNFNTLKNQIVILDAIYNYHVDMIYKLSDDRFPYESMRSYTSTLLRFWDWGYKNILPKDQFEIVKKYIKV